MELSTRDRMILDFERSWWKFPGPKEVAIREQLGISAGSYYRILNLVVDDPEAEAYDPLVVRRLRRTREQRRRSRYESRYADPRTR